MANVLPAKWRRWLSVIPVSSTQAVAAGVKSFAAMSWAQLSKGVTWVAIYTATISILLGQVVSVCDTVSCLFVKLMVTQQDFNVPTFQYLLTYLLVFFMALGCRAVRWLIYGRHSAYKRLETRRSKTMAGREENDGEIMRSEATHIANKKSGAEVRRNGFGFSRIDSRTLKGADGPLDKPVIRPWRGFEEMVTLSQVERANTLEGDRARASSVNWAGIAASPSEENPDDPCALQFDSHAEGRKRGEVEEERVIIEIQRYQRQRQELRQQGSMPLTVTPRGSGYHSFDYYDGSTPDPALEPPENRRPVPVAKPELSRPSGQKGIINTNAGLAKALAKQKHGSNGGYATMMSFSSSEESNASGDRVVSHDDSDPSPPDGVYLPESELEVQSGVAAPHVLFLPRNSGGPADPAASMALSASLPSPPHPSETGLGSAGGRVYVGDSSVSTTASTVRNGTAEDEKERLRRKRTAFLPGAAPPPNTQQVPSRFALQTAEANYPVRTEESRLANGMSDVPVDLLSSVEMSSKTSTPSTAVTVGETFRAPSSSQQAEILSSGDVASSHSSSSSFTPVDCPSWFSSVMDMDSTMFWVVLAFLDLEGCAIMVAAFKYASLASSTLIDCVSLLSAFLLGAYFLKEKCTSGRFLALVLGIAGSCCILASDYLTAEDKRLSDFVPNRPPEGAPATRGLLREADTSALQSAYFGWKHDMLLGDAPLVPATAEFSAMEREQLYRLHSAHDSTESAPRELAGGLQTQMNPRRAAIDEAVTHASRVALELAAGKSPALFEQAVSQHNSVQRQSNKAEKLKEISHFQRWSADASHTQSVFSSGGVSNDQMAAEQQANKALKLGSGKTATEVDRELGVKRMLADFSCIVAALFLGAASVMMDYTLRKGLDQFVLLTKLGFWASLIAGVQWVLWERPIRSLSDMSGTSAVYLFAAVFFMAVAMILTPIVLLRCGSAFFNLSLMTSGALSVILSSYLFGDVFAALYSVGLLLIMSSLVSYYKG